MKLSVDSKIYSLASIYSASYVFLDRAYIYLDKDDKGRISIRLFPKNTKETIVKLGMEFYNELINYAHYFSILKENAEAIKALMQRALFSAAPSLVKDMGKEEVERAIRSLRKPKAKR